MSQFTSFSTHREIMIQH